MSNQEKKTIGLTLIQGIIIFLLAYLLEYLSDFISVKENSASEYLLIGLSRCLWIILTIICLLLIFKEPLKKIGLTTANWKKGCLIGIFISLGMGLILFLFAGINYIHPFIGNNNLFIVFGLGQKANAFNLNFFLIELFIVGLIVPITEEIIFRGCIFNCFKNYMGVSTAIILSGMFFAVFHIPLSAANSMQIIFPLLVALTGGIIFGISYEKSKSLIAPIIIHSLGNSVLIIIPYLKF